jgi:hypothetical protein
VSLNAIHMAFDLLIAGLVVAEVIDEKPANSQLPSRNSVSDRQTDRCNRVCCTGIPKKFAVFATPFHCFTSKNVAHIQGNRSVCTRTWRVCQIFCISRSPITDRDHNWNFSPCAINKDIICTQSAIATCCSGVFRRHKSDRSQQLAETPVLATPFHCFTSKNVAHIQGNGSVCMRTWRVCQFFLYFSITDHRSRPQLELQSLRDQ